MITQFKIFESDLIYVETPHGWEHVFFDDVRANPIPFFYWQNELYLGEVGTSHSATLDYDNINYYGPEVKIKWDGRLYIRDKYIIFWDMPPKNKVKSIIYDLEEKTKLKILGNGWMLQVRASTQNNFDFPPEFVDAKVFKDTRTISLDEFLHDTNKELPFGYKHHMYSENKAQP
jgi:hypothetical protein